MKPEHTILKNLCNNDLYSNKVLPFLKEEYFSNDDLIIFRIVRNHILQYNEQPTREALLLTIPTVTGFTDDIVKKAYTVAQSFDINVVNTNLDWLVDTTEKFCQSKSLELGIFEAIEIIKGTSKKEKGAIPEILREALSVTFDTRVGHDYLEDFQSRFDARHKKEGRIPFDLDILNRITNGGLPPKTLSVIVGGINVGKSLSLCSLAASALAMGKNVLYITLEMSEEMIADRIDANLLNIPLDLLDKTSNNDFTTKIESLIKKTAGKLIIREYPSGGASATHFKALLNESWIKKKFKPDIVYIDYINICASSRLSRGKSSLYEYVKATAEEIRGLAQEYKIPIVSATQLTRSGYSDSNPDLDSVAESFGLPATADWMIAITTNDELLKLGQYLVKQIKTRLGSKQSNRSFVIGVDYEHQRLYEVEGSAMANIGQKDALSPTEMTPAQILTQPSKSAEKFASFKF